MAKYLNSGESISSSLLLWSSTPTQVAVQESYELRCWPVTNIFNQDSPIAFNLPPQNLGMLSDIHIVTKIKIQKDGQDLTGGEKNLSVINNFANSLWAQLDVQIGTRTDITQSMHNSYPYSTFFNHVLNSESTRSDYLFYNELWKMDEGYHKDLEESERTFWIWNTDVEDDLFNIMPDSFNDAQKTAALDNVKEKLWNADFTKQQTIDEVVMALGYEDEGAIRRIANLTWDIIDNAWIPSKGNPAASERSKRINRGQSVTLCSKLHCPLFNTSKCLPTNMSIRISLTKNDNRFLLLSNAANAPYSVVIEDCYLNVTYIRPRDTILQIIEEKLTKVPASYFITRPEILIKPIQNAGRIIRLTDIFHDKLPPFAFFCLQKSSSFEGSSMKVNPYTFIPFKRFNFYLDGSPYFKEPLEVRTVEKGVDSVTRYEEFGEYMRQMYATLGKSLKGDCLINSDNFLMNFMVAMSFGADKSSLAENHLNLQVKSSTYLEIDLGINTDIPPDMVLIVYAVYDRQIQIDKDRQIHIIE